LHVELLVLPNATNNEAAYSLYEHLSNSLLKLPDILSCQAETRRLALTLIKFVFADILVHKSVYKRLLISSSSRNSFDDGAIAETANACTACAAGTNN